MAGIGCDDGSRAVSSKDGGLLTRPDAAVPGPDAAAGGRDAAVAGPDAAAGGRDAAADGPDAAGATSTCSDLFTQDTVQEYAVVISPDEMAKLDAEFRNIPAIMTGLKFQTEHHMIFRYGAETVNDATIRLKGQSSWLQTVQLDGANAKMQVVISFDTVNPNARFHGVSKLSFDMPRSDMTFLHERLANNWLRDIGVPAPCSNSGRLDINGAYYGLYVVEESIGHHMLKEFFPTNADGDLWKGGVEPDTNKLAPNWARQAAFWAARDIPSMTAIIDLPRSILEWAAEAVLNDGDGYWGGTHNFYVYDQGAQGFVWMPTDTDATLEWLGRVDGHPIYWWMTRSGGLLPGQHYVAVINDPTWRARYVDAIATQLGRWDAAAMQSRIDSYAAQITAAVAADPHKVASTAQFQQAIRALHDEAATRPAFIKSWLDCERGAGGADEDGDGVRWCDDCNDANPAVHPGAPEICGNHIDDNCNGQIDEGC
jgi:hypothetical protein